ncbi:MAG: NUDIX domain-containing protein [Anaerolineaceae bacterium]|nr:NUDIX domain-containing protein [Anaerolineaceae bacterium]MBN2676716.1 NUDIX domain-containing protein [Anaerolineaceae bacterium]
MKRIRNSAKAIIIRDGCLLAILKTDPLGDYYILPGGGQHFGEPLTETVQREVLEETCMHVSVRGLRFIRDYISDNHEFAAVENKCHQVEFMFACDLLSNDQPRVGNTPDDDQIDVCWLLLEHLMDYRLYPLSLRPRLMEGTGSPGPIYLGDIN